MEYKVYIDPQGVILTENKVPFENQKIMQDIVHKQHGFYDLDVFYNIELHGRIEIVSDQRNCKACMIDCLKNLKGVPCQAPRVARIIPEPKPERSGVENPHGYDFSHKDAMIMFDALRDINIYSHVSGDLKNLAEILGNIATTALDKIKPVPTPEPKPVEESQEDMWKEAFKMMYWHSKVPSDKFKIERI